MNGEGAASADLTDHGHPAPVSASDVVHQREAETGSLDVVDEIGPDAVKAVEDPFVFVRRDSDPSIGLRQNNLIVIRLPSPVRWLRSSATNTQRLAPILASVSSSSS
jgi:hypothetical protein